MAMIGGPDLPEMYGTRSSFLQPLQLVGGGNELLVPYISGKSGPPIMAIYVANPYWMNLCFHNTLSLLLLRNAPPDEVCNAILVVLSLNSLATSIGFGVYRSLHNK